MALLKPRFIFMKSAGGVPRAYDDQVVILIDGGYSPLQIFAFAGIHVVYQKVAIPRLFVFIPSNTPIEGLLRGDVAGELPIVPVYDFRMRAFRAKNIPANFN